MISTFICLVLAVGSLLIQLGLSIGPYNVQTDLVFPRNGSVIKPVVPFPIVFALYNFSEAWQYKPVLNWRLKRWDNPYGWALGESGSMGWTTSRSANWGPPADLDLGVNASQHIGITNISFWMLEYEFRIGPRPNDCSGIGFQDETGASSRSAAWFHTGKTYFNISNITGSVPDITSGGPCPQPLGAVKYMGQNETNSTCPLLSWPRPDISPCALVVDSKVADAVSRAIKSPKCGDACPGSQGEGRRLEFKWSLFVALVPLLILVFSL